MKAPEQTCSYNALPVQVALPPNYPYVPISTHVPKDPPARSYKFTLDPFQRVAVNSIERNESVLVSAHTSAGKTVVAEYAIATCLNEKKRVVYTSPIKVRTRRVLPCGIENMTSRTQHTWLPL